MNANLARPIEFVSNGRALRHDHSLEHAIPAREILAWEFPARNSRRVVLEVQRKRARANPSQHSVYI
ncbi:MAG: hypothetical protein N2C14_20610 [Planctomycetales bacterium]